MKIYVFSACFLLCLIQGQCDLADLFTSATKIVDKGASAIVNQWIDSILDALPIASKTLDLNAIPLPTFEIPITPPALGMTLSGTMYNGTLAGFNTLYRIGSGQIQTDLKSLSFYVTFVAGVKKPTLNGSMVVNMLKIWTELSGTLEYVNASVGLRAGLGAKGPYARLETLSVTENGSMSMKITGLGPLLNAMIETIGQLIFEFIKNPILRSVENAFNKTFSTILRDPSFITGKVSNLIG